MADQITEWRIEVKLPGTRAWTYTPFSGSVDRNERRIRDLLARECVRAGQPSGVAGWQFRLMSRTGSPHQWSSWEVVES